MGTHKVHAHPGGNWGQTQDQVMASYILEKSNPPGSHGARAEGPVWSKKGELVSLVGAEAWELGRAGPGGDMQGQSQEKQLRVGGDYREEQR